MVADNVVTVANLLDATVELGLGRLVLLGGSLEHGPSDRPHREDDAPRPTTLRGATKAAATLLALAAGGERWASSGGCRSLGGA